MKISGRVVSTKPISLSRAAKLISRFAAVENGSSPAVSMYLQRTSEAFNHLVQFHSKAKNINNSEKHIAAESELRGIDNLNETIAKEKMSNKKRNNESENIVLESELMSIDNLNETTTKKKMKNKKRKDESEEEKSIENLNETITKKKKHKKRNNEAEEEKSIDNLNGTITKKKHKKRNNEAEERSVSKMSSVETLDS